MLQLGMDVAIDIEANSLTKPTQIWVIVCKEIGSDRLDIFRNVTTDTEEAERFKLHALKVNRWVGHNLLGYDVPVLRNLLAVDLCNCIDTLIISKLVNYSRKGHSIERYGEEFGLEKIGRAS